MSAPMKPLPFARNDNAPVRAPSPLERWTPEAQKLAPSEMHLSVPFHVHLGEAVDVARFHQKYFASVGAGEGQPARPGLDTVAGGEYGVTASTGDDILSLCEATQQAHERYAMASSRGAAAPKKRGRYLVGEIATALAFRFGGRHDERLSALRAAHPEGAKSNDALAAELEGYAALGEAHRAEIDGLGGFDPGLLDEARAIAKMLRDRPANAAAPSDEAARALALRNRLAILLSEKMNAVRVAARFVFRHHPTIVREATSAYGRRRRAASRRSGREGGGAAGA